MIEKRLNSITVYILIMNIQFVDREAELNRLEDFWKKPEGIYVLWGRRRVGKTALLTEFAKDKPSVYLMSTKETEKGILQNFSEVLARNFRDTLLSTTEFGNFKDLIKYIEMKHQGKLLLIIDEFPYLCDANESIPSILQKEWDCGNMNGINLILCGSTVSAMESKVLGSKSPLYGRRAGQYKLPPLDPLHAMGFFPNMPCEDYLRLYGVVGGTPEYLLKMDEDKDLTENILLNIADPGSMLYEEPELLFKSEMREPRTYFSIMKALSFGKATPNEIGNFVDVPRTSISRYLELLMKLDLVEKRIPVTEKKPEKTRRGRYFIKDPFFKFYFRFIFPRSPELEQGLFAGLEDEVNREFDTYMGKIFEDIVHSALIATEDKPFTLHKIGPWWDAGEEIDLIALNESTKEILFVECKWSHVDRKRAEDVLSKLKDKAENVKWGGTERKEYFMIAGKSVESSSVMSLEDINRLCSE